MSVIIRKKQTHHNLVQYLCDIYMQHAFCRSRQPEKKNIRNNNFTTWQGLTVDLIDKHLLPSLATVRGHIHREQKNLQSTKKPAIKKEHGMEIISKNGIK